MVNLTYEDHLHTACTQLSLATSAITSPRSIGTPIDMSFKYIVSYIESDMESQCEVWLNSTRGNHKFSSALDKYISIPFTERDEAIKNTFKYSFFKTFSAMQDLVENGFNYFGAVPANSSVFYGHKILFYTFLNYNLFSPSLDMTSNVYMSRTLELDEKALNEIRKDPVFIESYNVNYPGGLFNTRYERILSALTEIDEVQISSLSHQDDVSKDSSSYSLGSMALTFKAKPNFFSSMEDSLATVTTQSSLTDHISKFWNSACFISILEIPKKYSVPDSGSPYTYVRNSLVDPATQFAKVESITGLNNNGLYSNYGTNIPGVGSSPLNPGPYKGPRNNNNGGYNNNPIFGGGNKPNFIQTKENNPSTNNKQENNAFKKFIKNKADNVGRALTSEEARNLLLDFASQAFSNSLSSKRQKDLIENLRQTGVVQSDESFTIETPFLEAKRRNTKTSFSDNLSNKKKKK